MHLIILTFDYTFYRSHLKTMSLLSLQKHKMKKSPKFSVHFDKL